MRTNILFLLLGFLFVSCQTKVVTNFDKYENLSVDDKKEVNQYLEEAKKTISKRDDEIILLFQYNCFFNETLTINNKFVESFPKQANTIHYGQKQIRFPKNIGDIEITQSDGKKIVIPQKIGYDYITICYYKKEDKFFIHYYDFPKFLIVE
ncbi:MAG: hypothetical protein E2590_08575 [Chryseobacterium sp.]|nr:hypothetical protein [Chryseobacterium sp.]